MTAPAKTIHQLHTAYLHAIAAYELPAEPRSLTEEYEAAVDALNAANDYILATCQALALRVVRTVR